MSPHQASIWYLNTEIRVLQVNPLTCSKTNKNHILTNRNELISKHYYKTIFRVFSTWPLLLVVDFFWIMGVFSCIWPLLTEGTVCSILGFRFGLLEVVWVPIKPFKPQGRGPMLNPILGILSIKMKPGDHWEAEISYSWRLPDQRLTAGPKRLLPRALWKLSSAFWSFLQFPSVASEVGVGRGTLLFCLKSILVDSFQGGLISLDDKDQTTEGRGVVLCSWVIGLFPQRPKPVRLFESEGNQGVRRSHWWQDRLKQVGLCKNSISIFDGIRCDCASQSQSIHFGL